MSADAPKELAILDKKVLRPNEKVYTHSNIVGSVSSDRNIIRYKSGVICTTDKRIILIFKKLLGHTEEILVFDDIENIKVVNNNGLVSLSLVYERGHILITSDISTPGSLLNVVNDIRGNIKRKHENEFTTKVVVIFLHSYVL